MTLTETLDQFMQRGLDFKSIGLKLGNSHSIQNSLNEFKTCTLEYKVKKYNKLLSFPLSISNNSLSSSYSWLRSTTTLFWYEQFTFSLPFWSLGKGSEAIIGFPSIWILLKKK